MLDQLLERSEDLKLAALIAFAIGFEIAERSRPYQQLERRRQLKLDVLAFVVLAVMLPSAGKFLAPAFPLLERDAIKPVLEAIRGLPSPAKVAFGLVLVDLSLYWIHRSMHKFDFLWRAHEWHHSSEHLYWFSGFRTSVVHVVIYAVPQIGIAWLIHPTALEALFGGLVGTFFQLWMHANIPVSLGPLEWLVISPRYHRVHHAITENRYANLANFFPIWDRLFGTYVDPSTLDAGMKTGLGYPQRSAARMIVGV